MANNPVQLSPEEEQEKFLEDACNVVKQQAFHMKCALDNNNLKDALKHANSMILELRTSLLSPKNYYELYMQVFNELRHLEAHFIDLQRQGKPMYTLYELVQHAGNVLPRLYLLITVGSVYIRSKEAPAKDILQDLVEMAKGVQQPQRGLFLRTYLSQMTKDKLPDIGNEYEGEGGSAADSIDFIILNFTEMNKLWVRMQHQGPLRDKDKREKEREELKLLVGTNLFRVSQLEGVDANLYKESVLPRILEQIVNCKDAIAQEYLAECIIQVFPDEFHLMNLEAFLNMLTQLQPTVNVKRVLISLMDRLSAYGSDNPLLEEVKAFELLANYSSQLVKNMELVAILQLQVALVRLALKCYPKRLDYVDHILGACTQALDKLGVHQVTDENAAQQVVQLLTLPLETYEVVLTALELNSYPKLMNNLPPKTRKSVATSIVENIVKNGVALEETDKVETLLGFIDSLLTMESEGDGDESDDDDQDGDSGEEFAAEQNLVARMIHLFGHPTDNDVTYKILQLARKTFGRGGERRIRYTLPPLVFGALALVRRVLAAEADGTGGKITSMKVLNFCQTTIAALVPVVPATALRLYLCCAQACRGAAHEEMCYEFISKSYEVYEEELADSKAQISAIQLITATLQSLQLGEENYDTLAQRTTQYAAKLLKKPDQCRGIMMCSHLFWVPGEGGFKSDRRVRECLKRAWKVAEKALSSSATNIVLFIDILNHSLYFHRNQNGEVSIEFIQALLELVDKYMSTLESPSAEAQAYYENTLRHIRESDAYEGLTVAGS